MIHNIHQLETGYKPEFSPEIDEEAAKLREQAARIVAAYDGVLDCMFEMYRMARIISGDPIK